MISASKTALFIGRFQPFHLGHLEVVKQAIKENDQLIIAIGSTQYSFQPANPFTCGERIQMVENALQEARIPAEKYRIIPVPNIETYALWVRHVELYLPPFSKIYTGSAVVKSLFEQENLRLKNPYHIIEVKKKIKVSSTQIRDRILHDKNWQELLPKNVAKLLREWKATDRLRQIQEADK